MRSLAIPTHPVVSWRATRSFLQFLAMASLIISSFALHARAQEDLNDKLRNLTDAMTRVQAQLEESQRKLRGLQQQISELLRENSQKPANPLTSSDSQLNQLVAEVDAIREKQAMHDSQIATLDQSKVESSSKYPVRLSGMMLMTASVNTSATDSPTTPTMAMNGAGSTAATMRQSLFGVDAIGPRFWGAQSHADLRADFYGGSGSTYGNSGFARLRTAHAELDWAHTQSFFALDRPLMSPHAPDSLTAVSIPALAWSGNLWTWNPQVGASTYLFPNRSMKLRLQGAFSDVADPPRVSSAQATTYSPPTTAEQSRWPGASARIAVVKSEGERGVQVGASGYFAPHHAGSWNFASWAAGADLFLPLGTHFEAKGSMYRGQALGGLGGGAYKDYVYRIYAGEPYFRALDDVGGWMQWKERVSERLEFNQAFGIDNVPAHQLRPYANPSLGSYYDLVRNRTWTGNVIVSPSAYLLFSLEYRHLQSSFVSSPGASSDVIGLAAGYRF